MRSAFTKAFSQTRAHRKRGQRSAPIDPEVDEDEETYQEKHGRWLRETLQALNGNAFWLCVSIAHTSRQPVIHFEHWLQSKPERLMVELVCGKADMIWDEWNQMLWDLEMWPHLLDPSSYEDPEAEQPDWLGEVVGCSLEIATDYFLRVLGPCRAYPRLILWLIHRPHDVCCMNRKQCATDFLVATADAVLSFEDDSMQKFVNIFRVELQ